MIWGDRNVGQDPSPEGKGLECHAKEMRLFPRPEEVKSAADLNGGVAGSGVHFRTTSGNDVKMVWRGTSQSRQSNKAAEQTRHDMMRSQVGATAVGMRRH